MKQYNKTNHLTNFFYLYVDDSVQRSNRFIMIYIDYIENAITENWNE